MKPETNDYISDLLTEEEIKSVNEILARELGVAPDQLTPSAVLDADLGGDSLTKVELIMALEERFQVAIPDEIAEGVQTVEDVCDALARVLGR
jgi:acyl carrier protein